MKIMRFVFLLFLVFSQNKSKAQIFENELDNANIIFDAKILWENKVKKVEVKFVFTNSNLPLSSFEIYSDYYITNLGKIEKIIHFTKAPKKQGNFFLSDTISHYNFLGYSCAFFNYDEIKKYLCNNKNRLTYLERFNFEKTIYEYNISDTIITNIYKLESKAEGMEFKTWKNFDYNEIGQVERINEYEEDSKAKSKIQFGADTLIKNISQYYRLKNIFKFFYSTQKVRRIEYCKVIKNQPLVSKNYIFNYNKQKLLEFITVNDIKSLKKYKIVFNYYR